MLAGVCLLGVTVDAGALGRLFSTPEERAQLDAMRRFAEDARPVAVETRAPPGPDSAHLRVDGVVMRERGPGAVWVNGERVKRGDRTREGVEVLFDPGGRVRVVLPHGSGAIRLKAGQRVDLATGTVRDAYESDPSGAPTSGDESGDPGR